MREKEYRSAMVSGYQQGGGGMGNVRIRRWKWGEAARKLLKLSPSSSNLPQQAPWFARRELSLHGRDYFGT